MKRLVVGFVLVLSLLIVFVGSVSADPPPPRVNIKVSPPIVHDGDPVTAQCVYIPSAGDYFEGVDNVYMRSPASSQPLEMRVIRYGALDWLHGVEEGKGPFIWRWVFVSPVGEWEVSCGFIIDGAPVEYASATYKVVP